MSTVAGGRTSTATLAEWLGRIGIEHPRGVKRGLKHVQEVAARLDVLPPADTTIVVAGTNGKGSTTAFAEQLLLAGGHSVGTTMSPHVHRFNERVRIGGTEATDAMIVDALEAVDGARGDTELSYFEYAVLAALVAIRRAEVDFAVLEVGLGGRLDAVNVVDADVAVITSIGLDHQEYLGSTRELIGAEKAGIVRQGRPLVFGDGSPPDSVLDRARVLGAPVFKAGRDFGSGGRMLWLRERGRRLGFAYAPDAVIDEVNAATALQAVRLAGHVAAQGHVDTAAAKARNAGRFEVAESDGATWVLDVAHNPDGARFLARQLRERFAGRRIIHAIIGCLDDKDVVGIVSSLQPVVTDIAFADTGTARGRTGDSMRRAVRRPSAFAGSLEAAMAHFRSRRGGNGVILVCGSFDLVERARDRLHMTTPTVGNA